MSRHQSLSDMLAEATGSSVDEIEERAVEFEIEDPEDADWEYIE
jgi:hypothetical protein